MYSFFFFLQAYKCNENSPSLSTLIYKSINSTVCTRFFTQCSDKMLSSDILFSSRSNSLQSLMLSINPQRSSIITRQRALTFIGNFLPINIFQTPENMLTINLFKPLPSLNFTTQPTKFIIQCMPPIHGMNNHLVGFNQVSK